MAALACVALALAGCGFLPGTGPSTPPVADSRPAAATGTTPHGANAVLAARPPPRKVDDDPDRLLGLDEDGLLHRLGQPAFMRRDIPALLWRYAAGDCTLDVFLYRKGESGPFTVTHLAARSTNGVRSLVAPVAGAEINPRVCLGEVLRARLPSGPQTPTS